MGLYHDELDTMSMSVLIVFIALAGWLCASLIRCLPLPQLAAWWDDKTGKLTRNDAIEAEAPIPPIAPDPRPVGSIVARVLGLGIVLWFASRLAPVTAVVPFGGFVALLGIVGTAILWASCYGTAKSLKGGIVGGLVLVVALIMAAQTAPAATGSHGVRPTYPTSTATPTDEQTTAPAPTEQPDPTTTAPPAVSRPVDPAVAYLDGTPYTNTDGGACLKGDGPLQLDVTNHRIAVVLSDGTLSTVEEPLDLAAGTTDAKGAFQCVARVDEEVESGDFAWVDGTHYPEPGTVEVGVLAHLVDAGGRHYELVWHGVDGELPFVGLVEDK